jgi:hypothetical protein
MPTAYADKVKEFGRRWYRPWLGLLVVFASVWAMHLLKSMLTDPGQIVCQAVPGSRYRAAVEVDGLYWTADLEAGLACALKHDRRVLVAFHGMLDTNARVNEVKGFRERAVKAGLSRYVLVKLYTDYVPAEYYQQEPAEQSRREDGLANLEFEKQYFNTSQEPLYVVLQPKGRTSFGLVGAYEGELITDPGKFVRFLHNPRPAPREAFFSSIINKLRQIAGIP